MLITDVLKSRRMSAGGKPFPDYHLPHYQRLTNKYISRQDYHKFGALCDSRVRPTLKVKCHSADKKELENASELLENERHERALVHGDPYLPQMFQDQYMEHHSENSR